MVRQRRRPLRKHEWEQMQKTKSGGCEICKARRLIYIGRWDNNLEIDHIVPLFHGGDAGISNMRWLCQYHNRAKGHSGRKFPLERFKFIVYEDFGGGIK
jgi:5-methylcytosine-specific restriction endonuclease McrA